MINIENIDLSNPEFQLALQFVQVTNQSFFLTGKAGTGKSTFLKYIIANVRKNFVVVAPTGIAAINVGGETIHSFFQFPLRPLLPKDDDIKIFWQNSEKREIIEKLDTLFIDEVSMVRADLVDAIDYSLRKNGGNPELPFGGKQVVFVGDIFQLEPVTKKDSGEYAIINALYKSSYFFNAKVFEQIILPPIELQKVYRQATDVEFVNLLDKVRIKDITEKDIQKINSRLFSHEVIKQQELAINLTTRNDMAESVNLRELNKLETKEFIYNAEISGSFEESKYPTEPGLKLKVGAQVIFLKNDFEKRWVNGTIAKIAELHNDYVKVELNNKQVYEVDKRVWENVKFQYNKEKRKIEEEVIGTFKQYPLKLAWAINIHKSQGMTFDKTIVDFGPGAFASGQAYVALSRVTTFDGLFLKRRIFSNDILVDAEVKEFAKTYNDKTRTKELLKKCRLDFFKEKSNRFDSKGNRIKRKRIKKIDVIQISDLEVKIGNQIWMTKNLDVDCFLNGDLIKKIHNPDEWNNAGKEKQAACCYYDNDSSNELIYGNLYNWFAINDRRGIAPTGWRIPTLTDWQELVEYLGGDESSGGRLKDKGLTYWEKPNLGAVNDTLFFARPGGSREGNYLRRFSGLGKRAIFWSSTGYGHFYGWAWGLYHESNRISQYNEAKSQGLSVRCIKDE